MSAMNTPGPQFSEVHSFFKRITLPFSSTYKITKKLIIMLKLTQSRGNNLKTQFFFIPLEVRYFKGIFLPPFNYELSRLQQYY